MSYFILTLDTRAPEATWGPVEGAEASARMTVQYALNEGWATAAELRMSGMTLQMEVSPGSLAVQLPGNAPDGAAAVHMAVVDDVGNSAVRVLAVNIDGVGDGPAPSYGSGGMPVVGPELQGGRVAVSVGVTTRVRVRARTAARMAVRTHGRSRRLVAGTAGGLVTTSVRVRTAQRSTADLRAIASSAVARKPEGRGHEDELILLDLL